MLLVTHLFPLAGADGQSVGNQQRHVLLLHPLIELILVGRHAEDVPVPKGRLAVLLLLVARFLHLLGVGIGEGQHRLVHEGPKP